MATIRASCPTCGDVELTSRDVTAHVCSDNNQGSYAFRCPECRFRVSKFAEQRIIDLLVSSGVRLAVFSLPTEMHEPKVGPAITYDDLLEFHRVLEANDWAQLLESPEPLTEDDRQS